MGCACVVPRPMPLDNGEGADISMDEDNLSHPMRWQILAPPSSIESCIPRLVLVRSFNSLYFALSFEKALYYRDVAAENIWVALPGITSLVSDFSVDANGLLGVCDIEGDCFLARFVPFGVPPLTSGDSFTSCLTLLSSIPLSSTSSVPRVLEWYKLSSHLVSSPSVVIRLDCISLGTWPHQVVAVDRNHHGLMKWSPSQNGWENIVFEDPILSASIASDGTLWVVGETCAPYRKDLQGWIKLGGRMRRIVTRNNFDAWGIDPEGALWRWSAEGWLPIDLDIPHESKVLSLDMGRRIICLTERGTIGLYQEGTFPLR